MNCPRCGKIMVEKPPTVIYSSNPPQWDVVMWCGCGYEEYHGRKSAKTEEETLKELWERANIFFNFDKEK